MKRILFVDCSLCHGGAQRSLYTLIDNLPDAEYERFLLCANDSTTSLLKQCRKRGYQTGYLPMRTWKRNLQGVRHAVFDLMKGKPILSRWLNKHEIDVVHANGLQAGLVCSLVTPKEIPLVFHHRDVIAPDGAVEKVIKRANHTLMVSDFLRDMWRERMPEHADKISTAYNGFDFEIIGKLADKLNYREANGWPDDQLVISMIADLVPWKRHELFIEAFELIHNQHPNAFAFIIGGPRDKDAEAYESELLKKIAQRGLDSNMAITGQVPNPFPLIKASDVVLSVADREPFGRNIVETLACGKPMVIAGGGGPVEIAKGCSGATVLESDSPADIAAVVLQWAKADKATLETAKQDAHRAAKRFTIPQHIQTVSAVYKACCPT